MLLLLAQAPPVQNNAAAALAPVMVPPPPSTPTASQPPSAAPDHDEVALRAPPSTPAVRSQPPSDVAGPRRPESQPRPWLALRPPGWLRGWRRGPPGFGHLLPAVPGHQRPTTLAGRASATPLAIAPARPSSPLSLMSITRVSSPSYSLPATVRI